jgi:uncharacterized membrane protein (DUF485 family)
MDHGPSSDWGQDVTSGYKTRLGLWMFLIYSIVYAGFVVINSVWPKIMEKSIGSLNLATIYGFGLIVLALVMALIYNSLSSKAEERVNSLCSDGEEE